MNVSTIILDMFLVGLLILVAYEGIRKELPHFQINALPKKVQNAFLVLGVGVLLFEYIFKIRIPGILGILIFINGLNFAIRECFLAKKTMNLKKHFFISGICLFIAIFGLRLGILDLIRLL